MTTKLDKAINTIKNFIGYEDELLNKRFDDLVEEIKKKNASNLEAIIPIGRIEEDEADICNLIYLEDYEVNTFSRIDGDYNEWETKEDYEKHIREQADEKFSQYSVKKEVDEEEFIIVDENDDVYSDGHNSEKEAYDAIAEMKEEGEETDGLKVKHDVAYLYDILDDDGDVCEDGFDSEEEALERIQELKQEFIEEKSDEFDEFEIRYDEIYWNTVYQYGGYVNEDLAKELGLGVLSFNRGEHEGEEFMFLQGCGMDLSPKFIAYKAIEFGYIDEDDIRKLARPSDREYFSYVVGDDVYKRVIRSLGIENFVNKSA